jgi:hypothetical protein
MRCRRGVIETSFVKGKWEGASNPVMVPQRRVERKDFTRGMERKTSSFYRSSGLVQAILDPILCPCNHR